MVRAPPSSLIHCQACTLVISSDNAYGHDIAAVAAANARPMLSAIMYMHASQHTAFHITPHILLPLTSQPTYAPFSSGIWALICSACLVY